MKTLQAVLLTAVLATSAMAGEKNYKVDYVGGSLNLKAKTGLKLYIMRDSVELRKGNDTVVSIPASALAVSVSRNGVKPPSIGLAAATLGWSSVVAMKHMKINAIGFDWIENGKPQNIVVGAGYEAREMLANLETLTGKKTAGL